MYLPAQPVVLICADFEERQFDASARTLCIQHWQRRNVHRLASLRRISPAWFGMLYSRSASVSFSRSLRVCWICHEGRLTPMPHFERFGKFGEEGRMEYSRC